MRTVVLQIPMSKNLKESAEAAASEYGFSSLQEVLRVFMAKLAKKDINISFEDYTLLSPKSEKRYLKMDQDFKMEKNIYQAKTVKELVKQLHGDTLS